jgi:small ligand-binding sensory domain FIST
MDAMIFAAATSTTPDARQATDELVHIVRARLGARPVDFVCVFLSVHFGGVADVILAGLRAEMTPRALLGCSCEGVIGQMEEIEDVPAISLVAAHWLGAAFRPFALGNDDWGHELGEDRGFAAVVGAPADTKLFLMLADPLSTPMDDVLYRFNEVYPGVPIIGGMASAASTHRSNVLLLDDRIVEHGAVGLALSGPFQVDTIVSQGCRPIGSPFTVTAASRNIILELDHMEPLSRVQALISELSEDDRNLLRNGLLVGRAIGDTPALGRGDFLIRGVVGIDRRNGALAVGDYVHTGEVVQFHVRDQWTAEEDLELLLSPQVFDAPPRSALLFSCNGRGTRLYDHPNGDITTIQRILGNAPLAGFFCAGELGPIGGRNFLHGHTASMVLFRPEPQYDE